MVDRPHAALAKRIEALTEVLKRISEDSDTVLEMAQAMKRQVTDVSAEWQEASYVMSVMLTLQRELAGNFDTLAGVDIQRAKQIIRADV